MSNDQASAQPTDNAPAEPQNEGVQARINELTAKMREQERQNAELQSKLMEQMAQSVQLAQQAQRAVAPPPAPVDPLAQFKDTLDPTAMQAIQAAVAETQRRMEAMYAPRLAAQDAQLAAMAVHSEAAAIPNLPKEVSSRAAQLAAQWRQAGINYPPGDALNFALGEYQRGQLVKAAPVVGYDPRNAMPQNVIPGYTPPPQTQAPRALPNNFEQLNRAQQNAALEAAGIADQPM